MEAEKDYISGLPEDILVLILSRLSFRDAEALSAVCPRANLVNEDQYTWKERLWHHAKAVNICMVRTGHSRVKAASVLLSDPLLLNLRTMYKVLSPYACSQRVAASGLDMANLLAKSEAEERLLQQFLNFITKLRFNSSPVVTNKVGVYVLCSTHESRTVRSLVMKLVASKDNVLTTVGLIHGKPGGIGSGMTVEYQPVLEHLHNKGEEFRFCIDMLLVRRAVPRLLTNDMTRFIPMVGELVSSSNGVVCVIDALCTCHDDTGDDTKPDTHVDGHSLHLSVLHASIAALPPSTNPTSSGRSWTPSIFRGRRLKWKLAAWTD